MYEVTFQAHFEHTIDLGRVIVGASSQEAAIETALAMLELPPSRAQCQVKRLKSCFYEIERREIDKPDPRDKFERDRVQLVRADPPILHVYSAQALARIRARSDTHALRLFVQAIQDKCATGTTAKNVIGLILDTECIQTEQRALKSMEQVELYKAKGLMR